MESKKVDLKDTIKNLKLSVLPEFFVFVTVEDDFGDFSVLKPKGTFLEKEGMSLIITQDMADKFELEYEVVLKCIVLDVVTSLEMVGLSAYISKKLFQSGISANIVAANYHDYIFVPKKDIKKAYDTLYKID